MRELRNIFDVRVPMRDGVTLSADLYLPAVAGRHPAIPQRTPCDNTMPLWVARWPAYDRNPDTGAPGCEDAETALAQLIPHDAAHPSHPLAPVRTQGEE